MWDVFRRIVGLPPAVRPVAGEVLAAPVAVVRDPDSDRLLSACGVFAPAADVRDDPVFASRSQFRIQEVLYDGVEPNDTAERAVRDRLAGALTGPRPRVYHLSNDYAPRTPMFAAEFDIPAALYDAGYDPSDLNTGLIPLRFRPGRTPTAEVLVRPFDPEATARRRLEVMLARGARFVWAELVQANFQLYRPGPASAACMVLFGTDYGVTANRLRDLAARLYDLKYTPTTDRTVIDAAWPLEASDRAWYYHRRVKVPAELTGGANLYLADLWVHRPFIRERFYHRHETGNQPRPVPCLLETKDWGWTGIELVPHAEADEYRRRASPRGGDW